MLPKVLKILVALLVLRLALMAVVPVFEPSEARYAAISANMARTGDFVVPRFTHNNEYQSFDGKPPLVFQAGGVFCRLFGTERPVALQFAVRLFPFLSAVLMLAILFVCVRRKVAEDPRGAHDGETPSDVAWLAVGVCASSTAFLGASGVAMTDMTLTCCVAGALLLYDRFARTCPSGAVAGAAPARPSFACAAGVAALLGAGMIVKGPVALVEFGLPVFVDACVNRRWGAFPNWRWLAVSPVFFLVAAPWFVCIERVNPGAVWYFFYNENFLRFVSHDYGDKYGAGREAFRGVSVLWTLVATLPWSLVPVGKALVRFRAGGRAKVAQGAADWLRSFEFVSLAAIVGFWCLTSRVLLYYLFPTIPLFAAALALHGDRKLLRRLLPAAAAVSAVVLAAALGVGSLVSQKMRGPATTFTPIENRYAYEFYHGTPSPAALRQARTIAEQWREQRRAARAK